MVRTAPPAPSGRPAGSWWSSCRWWPTPRRSSAPRRGGRPIAGRARGRRILPTPSPPPGAPGPGCGRPHERGRGPQSGRRSGGGGAFGHGSGWRTMGSGRLDRVRRGRAAHVATGRDPIDPTKRTRMAHQDTTADDEESEVSPANRREVEDGTRTLAEAVGPWLASDRAMLGTLGVLAAGWAIVLGRLIVLRHERFATFDFDEGIQDQLIWQLADLRQFTTVRGVPFLGNHASFGFVLLAPLAWLGAGPNTWNVLNAVALASCRADPLPDRARPTRTTVDRARRRRRVARPAERPVVGAGRLPPRVRRAAVPVRHLVVRRADRRAARRGSAGRTAVALAVRGLLRRDDHLEGGPCARARRHGPGVARPSTVEARAAGRGGGRTVVCDLRRVDGAALRRRHRVRRHLRRPRRHAERTWSRRRSATRAV